MSYEPCGLHYLSKIKQQVNTNNAHFAEIKSKGVDGWERVHNIIKERVADIRLYHSQVSGFSLQHQ